MRTTWVIYTIESELLQMLSKLIFNLGVRIYLVPQSYKT